MNCSCIAELLLAVSGFILLVFPVNGGVDDTENPPGQPSNTRVPLCWKYLGNQSKEEGPVPLWYKIVGLCDWEWYPETPCVLLQWRSYLHYYYLNNHNETLCRVFPMGYEESKADAVDQLEIASPNDTKTQLTFNLHDAACNNETCSIKLPLKLEPVDEWNSSPIDLKQYPELHEIVYSQPISTKADLEDKNNSSERLLTGNFLQINWSRTPEYYEKNEINYSSVGAPEGLWSGFYRMDDLQLSINTNDGAIRLHSCAKERFRTRPGDYYACKAEQHVSFYANEKHCSGSSRRRSPAPQIVLEHYDFQMQLMAKNHSWQFKGSSTNCVADMENNSIVTVLIFCFMSMLIVVVIFCQAYNRFKEKEKASKLAELEGLGILTYHQYQPSTKTYMNQGMFAPRSSHTSSGSSRRHSDAAMRKANRPDKAKLSVTFK